MTPNKTLQPTPGSGCSSAVQFTSLDPAWLSLVVVSFHVMDAYGWFRLIDGDQQAEQPYSQADGLLPFLRMVGRHRCSQRIPEKNSTASRLPSLKCKVVFGPEAQKFRPNT
jgi:hypothetical protein